MLQIYCPYCGEAREEEEFHYGGEAHIVRPVDPELLSDEEWGHYLFHRKNIKGRHQEMWFHAAGCRKFFNVTRNTVTYQIEHVYKIGESAPAESEEAQG
ncbi:sarcosine oxidase subunit delta [Photobacterium proteolyticum]|uniref:Sarcosine oxidase subunit delta n=1 Tax=Photobacterium proteolyticum TaxID=1903952 RepID=A0A1Q9G697_9GAMM|nr:sarcosine oxidase subunit delta [Photobacterium proteolyticum]OLQ69462.1 sarcosine oxidase subunit delta [Photobacterium proteolyticum]